jgi:photosystem II stability/assembly factor-like uncharacterized protein
MAGTLPALFLAAWAALGPTPRAVETGWTIVPTGQTRALLAVFFVDNRTGWIAGEAGLILRSDDGGARWKRQPSGVASALQSIAFTDHDHGWAAGNLGVLLYPDDGGKIWRRQNPGTRSNLYAVHFADVRTGWACGQDGIVGTTDGGATWTRLRAEKISLEGIFFRDAALGLIVGECGRILRTADAGRGWTDHSTAVTDYFMAVATAAGRPWWAAGLGYGPAGKTVGVVFGSVDGGLTWIRRADTPDYLEDICFPDPLHGRAVGEKGTILATDDGGATWRLQPSGSPRNLRAVFFLDAALGWAVGDGGLLLRTAPLR